MYTHDFVQDWKHDRRLFRSLNIVGDFATEAPVISVKRQLNSSDVDDVPTGRFILRGTSDYIRSDNGAESIAKKVRVRIEVVGAKIAFIEPESP